MKNIISRYWPVFALLVLSIPLYFLNVHDIHGWGDDYAQYIREADNIAHGRPFYRSGYVFNAQNIDYAPPQYPPGYPLLLAPIVKAFGLLIRPMLYLNAVLLSGFLFILFAYFRKYASPVVSICIAVIAVYCGFLLEYKQNVLSDLPCTVFVALYLLVRRDAKNDRWRTFGLIVIGTIAILIRTQAIMLVVAEITIAVLIAAKQFYRDGKFAKVQWRILVVPLGILALQWCITSIFFKSPASTLHYYSKMSVGFNSGLLIVVAEDFNYFMDLLGSIFYYPLCNSVTGPVITLAMRLSLICCLHGFLMTIRKRLAVEDVLFILFFLLVLIIPVRQGFRLLLPVFLVILFYCYQSLKVLVTSALGFKNAWIAVGITVAYLVGGANAFKASLAIQTAGTPYDDDSKGAFQYIRQNVGDSDVIIFPRPRALTLYTGKKSMVAATQLTFEENAQLIKKIGARYLLVSNANDFGWYNGYLRNSGSAIDSVRINDTYTLYSLKQ